MPIHMRTAGDPNLQTNPPDQTAPSSAESFRAVVEIPNKLGLHLRPASQLVKLAAEYEDCEIHLSKDGQQVNAKSIMGVIMLAAEQGSELVIQAMGLSSEKAVGRLVQLIQSGFGEE